MLQLIKTLLLQYVKDIDSGNSNISESEQEELLQVLQKLSNQKLTKLEAAAYVGVSRATFDNRVKNGIFPKGTKRIGSNLIEWNKSDLNKFKKNDN